MAGKHDSGQQDICLSVPSTRPRMSSDSFNRLVNIIKIYICYTRPRMSSDSFNRLVHVHVCHPILLIV